MHLIRQVKVLNKNVLISLISFKSRLMIVTFSQSNGFLMMGTCWDLIQRKGRKNWTTFHSTDHRDVHILLFSFTWMSAAAQWKTDPKRWNNFQIKSSKKEIHVWSEVFLSKCNLETIYTLKWNMYSILCVCVSVY